MLTDFSSIKMEWGHQKGKELKKKKKSTDSGIICEDKLNHAAFLL